MGWLLSAAGDVYNAQRVLCCVLVLVVLIILLDGGGPPAGAPALCAGSEFPFISAPGR